MSDVKKELQEAVESHIQTSASIPSRSDWLNLNIEQQSLFLSVLIVIFGCVIIWAANKQMSSGSNPDSVLKVFGGISIVILSVLLIAAGFSDQQISPVIGLLGTMAGYILGKNSSIKEKRIKPHERQVTQTHKKAAK